MKYTWQVWNQALAPEDCDYIISKGMQRPPTAGSVGNLVSDGQLLPEVRVSTLRWLDIDGEDRDIADQLMWFFRRSNLNVFGFDITEPLEVQFTEYVGAEGGKYDWHQDVMWQNDTAYDRKLSIVVQLSHPEDYAGGDFEFFGYPRRGPTFESGAPFWCFLSFFYHRVLPVTSGVRRSLVSWVVGPKFR